MHLLYIITIQQSIWVLFNNYYQVFYFRTVLLLHTHLLFTIVNKLTRILCDIKIVGDIIILYKTRIDIYCREFIITNIIHVNFSHLLLRVQAVQTLLTERSSVVNQLLQQIDRVRTQS